MHVGELLLELRHGLLSEVAWYEEVAVSDEEVGEGLFHVALYWLLQVFGHLAEITALVEHFCVELLESALVCC